MNLDWTQLFVTLILTIPGVWALVKQLKKEKGEAKRVIAETEKTIGADTSEVYAKAAEIAAKQNLSLYDRIDKQDIRIDELYNSCLVKDDEIEKLTSLVQKRDKRIGELEIKIIDYEKRIEELEREVALLRSEKL